MLREDASTRVSPIPNDSVQVPASDGSLQVRAILAGDTSNEGDFALAVLLDVAVVSSNGVEDGERVGHGFE